MSFSGKIRAYLILVALVTPLMLTAVIYFYSLRQLKQSEQRNARQNYERYLDYQKSYKTRFPRKVIQLAKSPSIKKAILHMKSGRLSKIDISDLSGEFDFIEILDKSGRVVASQHRPGLVGEIIAQAITMHENDSTLIFESEAFDGRGRHAAIGCLYNLSDGIKLYAGKYIDDTYRRLIGSIVAANIILHYHDDPDSIGIPYPALEYGRLYLTDNRLYALLAGGSEANFRLVALFDTTPQRPLFMSLLRTTAIVGGVSVIIALLLGWYITGRARREIDNLISAADKIAQGDLTTPVMALEEGEFSQLADSMFDMKTKLRKTQADLTTAEKIAAWKVMSQKIAHEVKNPLTPIEISIDDLRRSYYEKLPDFDKTLDETTSVIKTEIRRLINLLDQFVSFARMSPPKNENISALSFIDEITQLYGHQIESGRVRMVNRSHRKYFGLDGDRLKQLLINLIKNGLESAPETIVEVTIDDIDEGISILIEDNGPGFTQPILESGIQPYMSTKKDGSGLGLVVCRRIVFDFDGQIELYNQKQGGAAVRIELPMQNG